MKTIFSNNGILILGIICWSTLSSIEHDITVIPTNYLQLEENLLQIAQETIADPYYQYVKAFVWLNRLKNHRTDSWKISQEPISSLEQQIAFNIVFNTNSTNNPSQKIIHKISKYKLLQFFWPGRLIFLAWYPSDFPQLDTPWRPTNLELLQAATYQGYLIEELQLQYGCNFSDKKIRQNLQYLMEYGVQHIHYKDAQTLIQLLLESNTSMYRSFLENKKTIIELTKDPNLHEETIAKYSISRILSLTRPENSVRDFFESWGCCPV